MPSSSPGWRKEQYARPEPGHIGVHRLSDLAERGDPQAQYAMGRECEAQSNNTNAVRWYRRAAKQGHEIAMNNLACCYNTGEGVKTSSNKALKWFKRSATSGNSSACFNLGLLYENLKHDPKTAVEYYLKAAAQGDADAQNKLGLCYDTGTGVDQSDSTALEWYAKAAEQGDTDALNNLRAWYQEHGPGQEDHTEEVPEYNSSPERPTTATIDSLGDTAEYCLSSVSPAQDTVVVPLLAHRAVVALRRAASLATPQPERTWGAEDRPGRKTKGRRTMLMLPISSNDDSEIDVVRHSYYTPTTPPGSQALAAAQRAGAFSPKHKAHAGNNPPALSGRIN